MNLIFGLLIAFSFSTLVSAADTDTLPTTQVQSSDDYYDGGNIDAPPVTDQNKGRSPASGDLPYSDDEIQKNTPENYAPKNMPVDQE